MSETEENTVFESSSKFVENGKNKMIVKCKYCGSKILEKDAAVFLKLEKDLPLMTQDSRKGEAIQNESVTEFYHVENMYAFENIGFTHTVGNCKYLSCADCEAGPLGFSDLDTKHSYVALSRVEHA